jgi:hypothetical protein
MTNTPTGRVVVTVPSRRVRVLVAVKSVTHGARTLWAMLLAGREFVGAFRAA